MQSVKFLMQLVENDEHVGEAVVRQYPPHLAYKLIWETKGETTAKSAKNGWDHDNPFVYRDKVVGDIYLNITTTPVKGS